MATLEVATLGGGCFWCIEAVFQQLQGVTKVVSGYAGGEMEDPDYETVCEGTTGHAEVVQVTFDSAVIPYRDILEVFFTVHDPTTPNRQGGDEGEQYRSVILTHSKGQEATARGLIAELTRDEAFDAPIVTQVEPLGKFYPAEEHHQDYFRRNPGQGYCQAVIRPKLLKFRTKWARRLKA
ncbi:MAG TPA: peptide-methionine (S)-S-oxide reductase MsrA [Candidatus Thermoplasmatota archaeon]|nr:peptide-methionine (S)-S-oxide reductase MsrA [Candidatus Thermoplasmatota archaeon]